MSCFNNTSVSSGLHGDLDYVKESNSNVWNET